MIIYVFENYKERGKSTKELSEEATFDFLSRNGYFSDKNTKVIINKTKEGKPFVKGFSVHLSISHTENICVIVVSKNPVGIDIEKIRKVDWMKISSRYFNKEEANYLMDECSPRTFYRLWTEKEAYAKMLGIPVLRIIGVDMMVDFKSRSNKNLYFEKCKVGEEYICTVCQSNEKIEVQYEWK